MGGRFFSRIPEQFQIGWTLRQGNLSFYQVLEFLAFQVSVFSDKILLKLKNLPNQTLKQFIRKLFKVSIISISIWMLFKSPKKWTKRLSGPTSTGPTSLGQPLWGQPLWTNLYGQTPLGPTPLGPILLGPTSPGPTSQGQPLKANLSGQTWQVGRKWFIFFGWKHLVKFSCVYNLIL